MIACLGRGSVLGRDPAGDIRIRPAQTRNLRHTKFEDVGIADWLLTGQHRETTVAKSTEQLAVLGQHDGYLDFIRTFFSHDLDVVATAKALNVHPNTVRHRVKRVESMFGESLRSPTLITAIHLSLEVLALEDDLSATGEPRARRAQ